VYFTLIQIRCLGLRQGIISNAQFYTPITINELLIKSGSERSDPFKDLFDQKLVFFSYKFGRAKPDSFLFEQAKYHLMQLGIYPSNVVYVGNDVAKDMIPARNAGFKCVLFAGDENSLTLGKDQPECREFEPDAIIETIPQLLNLIVSNEGRDSS